MRILKTIFLAGGLCLSGLVVITQADRVYLSPSNITASVGGYVDVAVRLDSGLRPGGALLLDIEVTPSGVLQFDNAYECLLPAASGFEITARRLSAASQRVLAWNASGFLVPQQDYQVGTLRYLVTGSNAAACAIRITNVVAVGTAAFLAPDGAACAFLDVTTNHAATTVAWAPPAQVYIENLAAEMVEGQIYPFDIMLAMPPVGLQAMDLWLEWPTNKLRMLELAPMEPKLPIAWQPAQRKTGAMRLIAWYGLDAAFPNNPARLATVWMEALPGAGDATLSVTASKIYGGPGLEVVECPSTGTVGHVAFQTQQDWAARLSHVAATNVITNTVIHMPLGALVGSNQAPLLVRGYVVYDTNVVTLHALGPSSTSGLGSATYDAAALDSGSNWFVMSQFNEYSGMDTNLPNLFDLQWQGDSHLFATGWVHVTLQAGLMGAGYCLGAVEQTLMDQHYLLVRGWPSDTNHNGVADWYQEYYGITNINQDTDGDGQSDGQEWLGLTDPLDPGSFFYYSIMDALTPGQGFWLEWPSVDDRHYNVVVSTNLLQGSLIPVATNIPGNPPVNRQWVEWPTNQAAIVGVQVQP